MVELIASVISIIAAIIASSAGLGYWLGRRFTVIETMLSENTTRLATLENRFGGLESGFMRLESRINSLGSEVSTLRSIVSSLEAGLRE